MAVPYATAAHDSLRTLLAGDLESAENIIRSALLQKTPPSDVAMACLLSDLGLCALHGGRPAEAAEAIRHSLSLLPSLDSMSSRCVEPAGAWVPLARAQAHLNLCEALVVQGQLVQMVHEAREAICYAQLAIPHHKGSYRAEIHELPTCGSTPRLFAAHWMWPNVQNDSVGGMLAAPEALTLAWLWCAIAQEGLGSYQEALRCYSRAMGVAHIDRSAALTMSQQLKKKIALTEIIAFGSEDTTGLTGQRVDPSEFKLGVPYGPSLDGFVDSRASAGARSTSSLGAAMDASRIQRYSHRRATSAATLHGAGRPSSTQPSAGVLATRSCLRLTPPPILLSSQLAQACGV